MGSLRDVLSKYGLAAIAVIGGLILLVNSIMGGQNNLVIIGALTIIIAGCLIALFNSGVISVQLFRYFTATIIIASLAFMWLDYVSVQSKLDFLDEKDRREDIVVRRLMDIRSAQMSYKKVHGAFATNFDDLIKHIKDDSMAVVMAIGSVPDTLTELKAVELGIVTRDTHLISVRDTLFPPNYAVDSIRYVPNSGGQEFEIKAGEIEKNKLMVKVFEVFASNDKILHGLDLSEEYIDVSEGLRVGSMTEPHTRGNWE